MGARSQQVPSYRERQGLRIIRAGERCFDRALLINLLKKRWIEMVSIEHKFELRVTPAGENALKKKIPLPSTKAK